MQASGAVQTPWLRSHRRVASIVAATVALSVAATAAADDPEEAAPPATPSPAPVTGATPRDAQRPLRLTLSTVGYTDTVGIYSAEPRLVASIPTLLDAELRLGGSYTAAGLQLATQHGRALGQMATTDQTAPGRSMAGGSLSVPWSVFRATVGLAAYLDSSSTVYDREVVLAVKPFSALEVSGALRHRLFVEMAEPLAVDEQAFYTAGPGGALDLLNAWPLTVNELRVRASLAPTSWSYAYGDWRGMDISDGTRGWNASAGAGASLSKLSGSSGPIDVTARWDTWAAGYRVQSVSSTAATTPPYTPPYYSPASIVTHSPGVEVRLRQAAFELAAEGGITFAPGQSFTGVFGGGSAILRLGRVSIAARAQARSDPWFSSRKAWVAVQSEL